MRERYLTISKMTGPDSPSKVAIKEAYDEALETHKQTTVTTAMTDAKNNADVTKALIRAEVPASVVDTLEKEADNADLNAALTEAKKNPEIAQKLAKKLVQAKGDDDVAAAIQGAKTEAALVTVKDPVERERIVEEATIIEVKIRTDLKARKLNEEAEIAFENAETTEAIDLIQTQLDAKAAALEAAEQAELKTREAASKVKMEAKAAEQKAAIAMRVADTKLRGRYFKVIRISWLRVRKISYEVGYSLTQARGDKEIAKALITSTTQSAAALTWINTETTGLKTTLATSGASEKVQQWVRTQTDKAKDSTKDSLTGISIFADMANAKIVAVNEITALKKASSKTLYQSKTKAAVDAAIADAAAKTAKTTATLTTALDAGIAKGKTLPGKMPKQPFNAKNAD